MSIDEKRLAEIEQLFSGHMGVEELLAALREARDTNQIYFARISNLEEYRDRLAQELDNTKKQANRFAQRLFIKARFEKQHEKSYTDDELEQMFGPWFYDGSTDGLSPRETRMLETLADKSAEITRLRERVAGTKARLEKELNEEKDYRGEVRAASGCPDPGSLVEHVKGLREQLEHRPDNPNCGECRECIKANLALAQLANDGLRERVAFLEEEIHGLRKDQG